MTRLDADQAIRYDTTIVMEISNNESLTAIFRALGDPTRLRIFEALRCCAEKVAITEEGQCQRVQGTLSVGDVCCRLDGKLSTISHHLRELRLAGLIETEKQGRSILCSVSPGGLALLREWLSGKESR